MALAILSIELPAFSRIAAILVEDCRVCSWIVVPVIAPVAGSCGVVPETNTRPAAFTAWLYSVLAARRRSAWQRCDEACGSFEGASG